MEASSPVAVVLQPQGLLHRFVRSKDISTIVERPERLRAVAVGVASAAARLETLEQHALAPEVKVENALGDGSDDLAEALGRLGISSSADAGKKESSASKRSCQPFSITNSPPGLASLVGVNHEALRYVHGEASEYVDKLRSWVADCEERLRAGNSEIPAGFSQGDLYCELLGSIEICWLYLVLPH